ncbi:MAG: hypothetical protein KF752_00690 [Pirellulaceae bacterium]|nr:hypothetical protein [Pirellulaceae bacterium]
MSWAKLAEIAVRTAGKWDATSNQIASEKDWIIARINHMQLTDAPAKVA